MLGLAFSVAFFLVTTLGGFFSEPSPVPTGAPPGAETSDAIRGAIGAVVALLVQVAIIFGLRSREWSLQIVAAAAAVVGSLGVFFVAFFASFEVIGGVSAWGWAAFLLLVSTGALYFAAAIMTVASGIRGVTRPAVG